MGILKHCSAFTTFPHSRTPSTDCESPFERHALSDTTPLLHLAASSHSSTGSDTALDSGPTTTCTMSTGNVTDGSDPRSSNNIITAVHTKFRTLPASKTDPIIPIALQDEFVIAIDDNEDATNSYGHSQMSSSSRPSRNLRSGPRTNAVKRKRKISIDSLIAIWARMQTECPYCVEGGEECWASRRGCYI